MGKRYLISCDAISSASMLDGCFYCGKKADTWDHIVPKSLLGPDEIENLIPACRKCNSSKGKKPLYIWRKFLRQHTPGYKKPPSFDTPDPYQIEGKTYRIPGEGFHKFISNDGKIIIADFDEYIVRVPYNVLY